MALCAFSCSLATAVDYVHIFHLGRAQNFTELFAILPYTSNYIFWNIVLIGPFTGYLIYLLFNCACAKLCMFKN